MNPNNILRWASYFQKLVHKDLHFNHKKIAGETLLLLKELGVINDSLTEIVNNVEEKLIERYSPHYKGDSSMYKELRLGKVADIIKPIFIDTFKKAFPGEVIFLADDAPVLWIHEVMHLVIDPEHEVGRKKRGEKTSKSKVEEAIDEIIINILGEDPQMALQFLAEPVHSFLEEIGEVGNASYDDKVTTLEEAIEVWGSAPIKNANKAELLRNALSTIKYKFKDKLEIDDDEELEDILVDAAEELTTILTKKFKDFISYIPEEREAKLKIFLRLLKKRFDLL